MGDGFEYRLTGWGQLPFNTPNGSPSLPLGIRLSPSARLEYSGFFAEVRLEGGAAQAATTPIGDNYFEATPSSTLSNHALGCWTYTPADANDTLRGNFCIRGLLAGYRIGDFQFRFGRNRYEVTEYENMFMANAFGATPHWANLYIPYGWLGGDIRMDRQRENETLRRLMIGVSMMNGVDAGYLGMLQSTAVLALAPGNSAPRFTFTGYVGLRGNPPPNPPNPSVADFGMAHGEGLGVQFDYSLFTAGIGYNHQFSGWRTTAGLDGGQERSEETMFADLHPGDGLSRFRFRGSFSWLQRTDMKGANPYDPPASQTEYRTEWTASWLPTNGLQISLGYLGAFGNNFASHQVFLGMLSTFGGSVPFGSSHR
ncbi:MAG: hypothetical protein U1F57_09910 [bacterium]